MSWIKDIWDLVASVAMLAKSVEKTNAEIADLRKDLYELALAVAALRSAVAHEKETSRLVLDNCKNDITHVKDNIAAKFDVLLTRLDRKVGDFENRLALLQPGSENRAADTENRIGDGTRKRNKKASSS